MSHMPPHRLTLSDIAGGILLLGLIAFVALLDWPAMDQTIAALWGGP